MLFWSWTSFIAPDFSGTHKFTCTPNRARRKMDEHKQSVRPIKKQLETIVVFYYLNRIFGFYFCDVLHQQFLQ